MLYFVRPTTSGKATTMCKTERKNKMTYYDSAEGYTLTKAQAWIEIVRKHNLDEQEFELFLKDCGDKKTYDAQIVLAWLGY